jgi:hypothetical protein
VGFSSFLDEDIEIFPNLTDVWCLKYIISLI